MHRSPLLDALKRYVPSDAHESEMRSRMIRFVTDHSNCFDRELLSGHITASALIVNADRTKTLLTHHGKLDRWLQLGGHADGDPDPLNVAMREAREESGLADITAVSEEIFDLDIHPIPRRHDVPEHFHYDIRFLFEADEAQPLTITPESLHLAWIPLDKIEQYTAEESMLRMIRKLRARQ